MDLDKNIIHINQPALNILGKTREECIGKKCYDVYGVEICRTDRCAVDYFIANKGKTTFPVGDEYFSAYATYFKDSKGKDVGYIDAIQCISSEYYKSKYNKESVDKLASNIEKLSEGNIDIDLTLNAPNKYTEAEYANFKEISSNLEEVRDSIKNVLTDTNGLVDALSDGNIGFRANAKKHKGNFNQIISGINQALEELTKPLTEAAKVLQEMSTGDLTVRVIGKYKNDMRNLADYINNLGDSLTDLISQLQDAIHTTASASSEISSTSDTLAAATQEQSSQTDEIATAMEEMSRTITENAHSVAKTADVAKHSGEVANDGGKVVQQTIAKMREISTVVKTSAENISKLGESSKKIGEIISVIDDIADQTNLLSLNAAIEAARAGEQGRGFAVVADSVGKLAISTASATKEIADMIKGIQVDTEAAVRAMEKGTSEVQSGIELTDNAGNSIQSILSGINELLDMINQIAAASGEQSATSEQIARNVSSISKVAANSAKNIEDVASTANELARMTETLTSLVSQFRVNVTRSSYGKTLDNKSNRYLED
jgi:methyl-accepting chemotaxis protein